MSESELESKAIEAAAIAVKSRSGNIPEEYTLRNGVVLGLRPMPPLLLNSVQNSIPYPEVPKYWDEDKGREEENPNHPAYIAALEERDRQINLTTFNCILYACTYIKSIPEHVQKPEDEQWRRLAKMAGISFDVNDEVELYLAWLRTYAITTTNDLSKLNQLPALLAGVSEEEVDDMMESFRSGEASGTDSPVSTPNGSTNGNHVQESDTRGSARNRRT